MAKSWLIQLSRAIIKEIITGLPRPVLPTSRNMLHRFLRHHLLQKPLFQLDLTFNPQSQRTIYAVLIILAKPWSATKLNYIAR